MWYIVDDENYKDYLLSVYKYDDGDDFEVRVREGNGLDEDGEWAEAIYIDHCKSLDSAIAIGKAFVMGIHTERENRNG